MARVPHQISVSRQLVLDVCEPQMKEVVVHAPVNKRNTFRLFKFGTFNIDEDVYIYGTEKNQYLYSNEHNEKKLPIVIARTNTFGKRTINEMVPVGNFSDSELEVISDSITYTLESHRVLAHYMSSRC